MKTKLGRWACLRKVSVLGYALLDVNETWWFVELLGYREGMPYNEASIKRNRTSQSLNSSPH